MRRTLLRANEKATVTAYRATSALMGHVPVGVAWPVARAGFLAGYAAWPAKRRIIQANAGHILGVPPDDPAAGRLARRVYQTYARYVVELMRLPSRPLDEPGRLFETDGPGGYDSFRALYERTAAEGRSLIAVSCHIGSIETLVAAFATRGMPVYGLADDSAYPELYELLQAQRRRWGVEVVPWRNLRSLFRILRQPVVLGLLVDWGYRAEDVPVRLFGAWTTLPAGPAVLAARTGALLVPVACRRLPDGHYEAEHLEPIEVPDGSPTGVARATQAIADAVETMVREAPAQWYTFKRMWPATAAEAEALAVRAAQVLADKAPAEAAPEPSPA